jgi:phage shock protein PspC (stress-responsive transcriptional regulator)
VGLRAVAGDQRPVLRRVRRGRIIGGVAAGVARHYGLPVAAVRALLLLPVVGQLAYLVGWAAIPVEKPGEVVGPPPDHRPKRLVRVMVVTPAIVFAMLLGLTLYEGSAGFVAPPVPHDITSTAARSCLECHATGTDRAPVIDPLTHQFYDDEREHRSSLPFCGECHRLPEPGPTAGLQWDGVGPRQGDEGRLGAADLDLVWHMLGRIDSQPAAP